MYFLQEIRLATPGLVRQRSNSRSVKFASTVHNGETNRKKKSSTSTSFVTGANKEWSECTHNVANGYTGDTEEGTSRVKVNQTKKSYRKKFGKYPLHRIRLNGVKWCTVGSSDEESDCRSTFAGKLSCRGSKKNKNHTTKKTKSGIKSSKTTCNEVFYEGSCEESEPFFKHKVHVCNKKQTNVNKQRMYYEDVDTTASEASDVESLTD